MAADSVSWSASLVEGRLVHNAQDGSVCAVGRELSTAVVEWYRANGRAFPWRDTCDPFHILLAETLLRQTQAPRLVEPYLNLVAKYPNPWSLACADVEGLRNWFKPLGLVRRADHLVDCARILVEDHEGQVPRDLQSLEALPGLGRYSARAILCLAFEQPVPMIDEGAGRVLRRVLGHAAHRPAFSDLTLISIAEQMLREASPREFNLGLIDVAARYCRPAKPHCQECPLTDLCVSSKHRSSAQLGGDKS